MINTSKFDQAVLERYRKSFLPENKVARQVVEKLEPKPKDPGLNFTPILMAQGIHFARYQEGVDSDSGFEGTTMIKTPWLITHHLRQKINNPGLLWEGNRQLLWEGMKMKTVRRMLNDAPDILYERIGAVILLANDELDPTHEIEHYFDDWKARYIDALDAVDLRMQSHTQKSNKRKTLLAGYEVVLDQMSVELSGELLKTLKTIQQ